MLALWGEKKEEILELITADSLPGGCVYCLISGINTHIVLGAVTIASGMDFPVKLLCFRVRMRFLNVP